MTITFLLLGWLLHLAFWGRALVSAGRAAAAPGEWRRESALRAAMAVAIVAALAWPRGHVFRLGNTAEFVLTLAFLAGQVLAIAARIWLGRAWGLGVRPSALLPPVRSGPYAVLRHPIYVGTGFAILAQCALLQNAPAFALALAAVVLIPVKMRAERRAALQPR